MRATFKDTSQSTARFVDKSMTASFGQTTRVETADYNKLSHKPTINSITVEGDKVGLDYNLQNKMEMITEQEIDDIIYGG